MVEDFVALMTGRSRLGSTGVSWHPSTRRRSRGPSCGCSTDTSTTRWAGSDAPIPTGCSTRRRPSGRERCTPPDERRSTGRRHRRRWPRPPPLCGTGRGPRRTAGPAGPSRPTGCRGWRCGPGERLEITAVRDALGRRWSSCALRARSTSCATRWAVVHSRTRSRRGSSRSTRSRWRRSAAPRISSGPFWPGGMAAHADGSLHVVAGNHCHRLSAELDVLAPATAGPAPVQLVRRPDRRHAGDEGLRPRPARAGAARPARSPDPRARVRRRRRCPSRRSRASPPTATTSTWSAPAR